MWDWPTAVNTPGEPAGKLEYYTTCMDARAPLPSPSQIIEDNKELTKELGRYHGRL